MKIAPRSAYVQTLLPVLVLVALGVTLFGEPYFQQARRQFLLASVVRTDYLSDEEFDLEFEETFVDNNGAEFHVLVFTKDDTSQAKSHLCRIVVADDKYRLLASDDQKTEKEFHSACVIPYANQPILEIVRHKCDDHEKILVDRYDLSTSGIRVTLNERLLPDHQKKELSGEKFRDGTFRRKAA